MPTYCCFYFGLICVQKALLPSLFALIDVEIAFHNTNKNLNVKAAIRIFTIYTTFSDIKCDSTRRIRSLDLQQEIMTLSEATFWH